VEECSQLYTKRTAQSEKLHGGTAKENPFK
jgi:hypothetical protein